MTKIFWQKYSNAPRVYKKWTAHAGESFEETILHSVSFRIWIYRAMPWLECGSNGFIIVHDRWLSSTDESRGGDRVFAYDTFFCRTSKKFPTNYHNGVGVLSSWPWLTAELTFAAPPPPPPWRRHWMNLWKGSIKVPSPSLQTDIRLRAM